MKLSKDSVHSEDSYFWIPVFYDKNSDIYFCEPESKEFIHKFYQKQYWDNFWSKRWKLNFLYKFAFFIAHIPDLLNYRNFQLLKKLWYLKQDTKILEIWIWEWKNLIYLKNLWYNIHWIEMDPDNVKRINTHFNEEVIFHWNYEEIEVEWKYDIIYIRHVLEHFLDLDFVINNLKNNLNEWWILFIDVPFCENDFTIKWSISEHPHIYHFTRKSLRKYFEESNFQTLYMEYLVRRNIDISKIDIINKLYIAILMLCRKPSYRIGGDFSSDNIYDLVGIFQINDLWKK